MMVVLWAAVFLVGTVYNLTHDVTDAAWIAFWKVYMWIQVAMALVVIVWFSVGGVRDVLAMLRGLGRDHPADAFQADDHRLDVLDLGADQGPPAGDQDHPGGFVRLCRAGQEHCGQDQGLHVGTSAGLESILWDEH